MTFGNCMEKWRASEFEGFGKIMEKKKSKRALN